MIAENEEIFDSLPEGLACYDRGRRGGGLKTDSDEQNFFIVLKQEVGGEKIIAQNPNE